MRGYAILGPGGVGGLVAAALARAGAPVTVVAREEAVAAIERDGLRVRSVRLGDFEAHPRAVARLDEPVDVLIVATKATALAPALDRVEADPGLVVPLLNGIDHLTLLRRRFGDRAVGASIRVESSRTASGEIEHTSPFLRVELAGDRQRLEPVAADLRAAGIPADVHDDEMGVLWSKLTRLVPLATVTSAAGLPLGGVRADPRWSAALEGVVRETVAVARAEGAPADVDATLREIADVHDDFRSSMQRDLEARRAPELDAIAGAVLRAGERHGIACPTLAEMTAIIHGKVA
ncbi:MAG: ketopantoate reductase family protein [Solirubrobacteraceae bacterium]